MVDKFEVGKNYKFTSGTGTVYHCVYVTEKGRGLLINTDKDLEFMAESQYYIEILPTKPRRVFYRCNNKLYLTNDKYTTEKLWWQSYATNFNSKPEFLGFLPEEETKLLSILEKE